jgi:hypothetical protein
VTLVRNVVTKPGGSLAVGVRVRVRLIASDPPGAPGFLGATDRTIVGEWPTLTNAAGQWELDLEPNANITPANTVYEVMENVGRQSAARYYVSVPIGAGPYWVGDILTDAPAPLPRISAVGTTFRWSHSRNGMIDGVRDIYGAPTALASYDPASVGNSAFDFTEHAGSATYYLYDPAGYVNSAAIPSPGFWGTTIPARSSLALPAGTYAYDLSIGFGGTPAAGTRMRFTPFLVDNSALTDPIASGTDYTAVQSSYYNYKDLDTVPYALAWQGFLTFGAPHSVFIGPYVEGGSAALTIKSADVQIVRLA